MNTPVAWVPQPGRRASRPQRSAIILPLAAIALFATAARSSAPVDLATTADPASTTIGTPFRYTLTVTADRGVEVTIPTLEGVLGDFQVVDFGAAAPGEQNGRVVHERWFTLVTYTPGELQVPGPTVQYLAANGEWQSLAAPDAAVQVESLLPAPDASPGAALRDIKPPVAVARDYTPLVWIAAAAAVLGGLIWWLLRRRRRPSVVRVPAPRPAHELALEALTHLRDERLVEAGRHEVFYVRLSAIVREYVEARFRLRAPEMTSEEFLQAAQRNAQLGAPQRSLLGQFLGEADLVKFARHTPTANDAERAFEAARDFVHSTTPQVPRVAA